MNEAEFKKRLQPGATLKLTHWRTGGPYPRIVSKVKRREVLFWTHEIAPEGALWAESVLSFPLQGEVSFSESTAVFQFNPEASMTYEFISQDEFVALIQNTFPEKAEPLIQSAQRLLTQWKQTNPQS